MFEWEVTGWPKVGELAKELEPFASLWQIAQEFTMRSEEWLHDTFTKLDPEEVRAQANKPKRNPKKPQNKTPKAQHTSDSHCKRIMPNLCTKKWLFPC